MKKRIKLAEQLLIAALALVYIVRAQTCYDQLRLPRLVGERADDREAWMLAMAQSDTLNALFVAGMQNGDNDSTRRQGRMPVVMRMDMEQRTWRWRRSYDCVAGCQVFEVATAIAVNPQGTHLAITASDWNRWVFNEEIFLILLQADTGHYVSKIQYYKHTPPAEGEYVVEPSGIYFSADGIVYMAKSFGGGKTFVSRFYISAFDMNTNAIHYDLHQTTYLGEAMSIAYSEASKSLYFGGAVDNCNLSGAGPQCWMLAINRVKPNGLNEKQTQFTFQNGDFQDEDKYPVIDHLKYQWIGTAAWLFGTTRSTKLTEIGRQMYVFRLDTDALGSPRQDNLAIKYIDKGDWADDSLVTGVRPVMDGDKIQMLIYKSDDKTLHYMEVNFSTDTAITTTIAREILEKPFSVFHGSKTQSVDGIIIHESYSAITSKRFRSTTVDNQKSKETGAIFPSIRDADACQEDLSGNTMNPKIVDKTPDAVMYFQQAAFVAPALVIELDRKVVEDWSVNAEEQPDETWCSDFPAVTLNPGSFDNPNICFEWNDSTLEIPFNPITFASPTCTDSAQLIDYQIIDDNNAAGVQNEDMKITLNGETNLMRVTPLSTGIGSIPQNAPIEITIVGTAPDGVTSSIFTFFIVDSTCWNQVFTAPTTVADQQYYITDVYQEYIMPPFTKARAECPEAYSNSITPVNTWITGVSDYGGVGSIVGWQTNDEVNAGTYVVTIQVYDALCQANPLDVSYNLEVLSQCWIQPITIDPFDTVFTQTPVSMIQDVWQTANALTWDDSIISVPNPLLDCGPIEYTIENFDGTPVDPNVFTFTPAGGLVLENTFAVYTEDEMQEGLHDFVVKAWYTDYNTNVSTKDFTIQIDPDTACEDAYTITPSAPIADLIYTIDTAAVMTLPFDNFIVDPPRCVLGYTFTVSPTLPLADIGAITFDELTREFTIETSNIDLVYDLTADGRVDQFADYTIRVNALTPEGVDTGIGFDWVTTLKSPCHDALLQLDPSNFVSPIQYTAGFPQLIQQILDIDVISAESFATCPYGFTFDLKNQDGSNILGTVFSWSELLQEVGTETYDKSKIGVYPMRLKIKYDGHDYMPDNYFDFEIEIIDPCIDSATLIPQPQTDPPDYYYTGTTPKAVFTLNPFVIEPAGFCTATYSCSVSSGPRLDLCNINDGKSTGVFINVLGDYQFVSFDNMDQVPPGDYVFDIQGFVGTTVETVQFTLRLRDPCPDMVTLSIPGLHFTDQSYLLGAEESTQPWLVTDLVVSDAWVDCGTMMVDFYLADGSKTPLDGAIFSDRRSPLEFAQLQTIDFSHIGVYNIMYEVYYETYPGNSQQSQPFQVEILEACPKPTALQAIPSFGQEYTLTDDPLQYIISDFVVMPDPLCQVDYSVKVFDANGNEYPCSTCFDPVTREFTFHYDKDLLLSGPDFTDFTVEVSGTSGYLYPVTETTSFNLKLKNPCIDPNFVTIVTQPALPQSYILYDLNPTGHQWVHDQFTLQTVPIDHDFCGDFTYEATFMGDYVDAASLPMVYDADLRRFTIYSEDMDLIGKHPYSIEAHLTDYPVTRTRAQAVKSTIEIVDPCIDPFSLTMPPAQTTPPDYYYTDDAPALEFKTSPFTVFPPVCEIEYSCRIISGQRLDLCQVSDGQTDGFFDPVTGEYFFMSYDTANYKPGTYTMEVTGTSGLKSESFTVELVLVDPCFTVDLGLLPNPFADQRYVLRDPAIELPWRAAGDLINPATKVDCGPITVEFFNFDGSALDGAIFLDDQTNDPDNFFRVLYSEDVSKKGSYPIRYRVYHENYPLNVVEQPFPFVVTLINSCEDPKYLKLETPLVDQEYTITQDAITYQIPKFTIEPAWCDIIYSWKITDARGELATQFDANMEQRVFTFFNDHELSLAGANFTDYTITVTADAGIVTFKQDVAQFNLRISNPCIDLDFVQINKEALPMGLTYALWAYEPVPDGFKFTHDPFTVSTQPFDHELCGEVRYKVYFEGRLLSKTSAPLSYDTLTRQFEIYSEDWNLIGFHSIEVEGYFVDHPAMTTVAPKLATTIEIEHPCLRPAKISAKDSLTPHSYFYEEGGIDFFAEDNFTVDPPVCNITFECLEVQKIDGGSDNDVRCVDPDAVTFDPATGWLNFETADIDKYSLGQYRFFMRGTTGLVNKISADYSFIMRLANPCPYTFLRNLQEEPFADMRYILGRAALFQPFDTKDLVSVDARVDCGPIEIEFTDQFGRKLDDRLFAVLVDNRGFTMSDSAHQFIVKSQNDTETVGEYLIKYRARLKNWPTASVAVLQTPFLVTIVEQKLSDYIFNSPPAWLTLLEDQYILLGDNHKYVFGNALGDKSNFFGADVDVRVSLRSAVAFSQYDRESNALDVFGSWMTRDDIGLNKITVEVTYKDPTGREQKFSNFFYLHILEFLDDIIAPNVTATKNLIEAEYKQLRRQDKRLDRPIPYIAHYTRTGLMTIGWDRTMQAFQEHKIIPQTHVAVNLDLLDDFEDEEVVDDDSRRRELFVEDEQGQLVDDDGEYKRLIKVALLDALQLRMIKDIYSDYSESDVSNFEWDIVGFTDDYIWLQVSYENPENVGAFDSQDYIEVTFWGVEFFKSQQDVEVRFGTKLYWRIERQLSIEDAEYIKIFSDWMRWMSFAVFIFVFMFIGMGGRLLPTWMYFNTMQLIVHAPLLATYMPANLNYFLLEFLGLVRFYPEPPNNEDALERHDGLRNYQMSLDRDSEFSFLLNDCGYKHLFSRNLIIIIVLLTVCTFMLIPILAYDLINAPPRKPRKLKNNQPLADSCEMKADDKPAESAADKELYEGGKSEDSFGSEEESEAADSEYDQESSESVTPKKDSKKSKKPTVLMREGSYLMTKTVRTKIWHRKRPPLRHCACMSNFTLRVVYECFFEIFLCLLIHVSTAFGASESLLVFSLILFLLSIALIVVIGLLFCWKGPYMEPNVYRDNSLKRSFWGARHLYKLTLPKSAVSSAVEATAKAAQVSSIDNEKQTSTTLKVKDKTKLDSHTVSIPERSSNNPFKIRPIVMAPPMTVIEDSNESATSPKKREDTWQEDEGANTCRRLLTLQDVAPVDDEAIRAEEHQVSRSAASREYQDAYDRNNDVSLDDTIVLANHNKLDETPRQTGIEDLDATITQQRPPTDMRRHAGSSLSMTNLDPVVKIDQPQIHTPVESYKTIKPRPPADIQFNAQNVLEKSGIRYGPSREVTPEKQNDSNFYKIGTTIKKVPTQKSLWSQMDGYFEGGCLENTNTYLARINCIAPKKGLKKKKKGKKGRANSKPSEQRRSVPANKKPYLHMKPFVKRKMQQRHDQLKIEAKRHVAYQEKVYAKTQRYGYRTLFYGLRKNHPHNVAVVHPIAFLLRRVLYSIIIVFMARNELNVLFGCMLLFIPTMVMLTLILVEREWEDNMINWQHFINEVGIYLLICTLICFCGLINDVHKNLIIGYIMIGLICALIVYNLIVIMYDSVRFIRLLYYRFYVQIQQFIRWLKSRNWRCRDPNDPTPACRRWYRRLRQKCKRDPNKSWQWRAWCMKKFQPPPAPEYESSSSHEEIQRNYEEDVEVKLAEFEKFDVDLIEKPSTPLPPVTYELHMASAEPKSLKIAENQVAPLQLIEEPAKYRRRLTMLEPEKLQTELDWFRASKTSKLFEEDAFQTGLSQRFEIKSINEKDFFQPDDNLEGVAIEESLIKRKMTEGSQLDNFNNQLSETDFMDGNTILQTNPQTKRNSIANRVNREFSDALISPSDYLNNLEFTEKRAPRRNASNALGSAAGGGHARMFMSECQKPNMGSLKKKKNKVKKQLFNVRKNNLMSAGKQSLDLGSESKEIVDLDSQQMFPQMLKINNDNMGLSELGRHDQYHNRFMQGPVEGDPLQLQSQPEDLQWHQSQYRPNTTLLQYASEQPQSPPMRRYRTKAGQLQRNMSLDFHDKRLSDIYDAGSGIKTPQVAAIGLFPSINANFKGSSPNHKFKRGESQRNSIFNLKPAQGNFFKTQSANSGVQTPSCQNKHLRNNASRNSVVKKAGANISGIISLNSETSSFNMD